MKLLVIGASGLIGSHIYAEALSRGHQSIGTYRNHACTDLQQLDLASIEQLSSLLDSVQPTAVVHAAGWTWVDGCESDPARAYRENAEQPTQLAALCAARGIRIVYFSTSYIFDGSAGPYAEDATPSPINTYAKSKAQGEERVRTVAGTLALIPRVICVWGRESQKKNFGYQAIDAITHGKAMRIPSDQLGNPTWAGDIAAWTLDLLEAHETGIWNLASPLDSWSRPQWLDAIHSGLAKTSYQTTSVDTWSYQTIRTAELKQAALRPLHAGLLTDKIQKRFPRHTREPSDIAVLLPPT